jgi:hypothetical protein
VPNEALSAARAVILPAELVARPSEAWRLWLQAYPGERVVIPTPTPGWQWVAGGRRSLHVLASQAADTIRRLAEGEEAAPPRESSLGMGVVYVFAALFALELVLALAAFLINLYL